MDLYNEYCDLVLGLKNVGAPNAKGIINNKKIMENVTRIDNYPVFVPQKGDIAVWLGGKNGHVAICLGEGNTSTFKTLDQNWVTQKLTEETHNYEYMKPLVFLRPKDQSKLGLNSSTKTFTVRVNKAKANVRKEPNTKSSLVKQPSGRTYLMKGTTFEAIGLVKGEKVDGIDTWYQSAKGNYVWSWGLNRI